VIINEKLCGGEDVYEFMKEILVKRNWWIFYFYIISFGGVTLYPIIDMSIQIIKSWPGARSSWVNLIIFAVIMIPSVVFLGWQPILFQLMIKFTDEYIKIPTITKYVILPWNDIKSIKVGYSIIEIIGKNRSVKLNAYLFNNPERVLALIKNHVPSSTAWQ
jgi:hypothetical protein